MNRKNCSTLCCSSYDEVVGFKFKKDDYFTKKLIDNYFYCFFDIINIIVGGYVL